MTNDPVTVGERSRHGWLTRRARNLKLSLIIFACVSPLIIGVDQLAAQELRTQAERANFLNHTSHAEMVRYLETLQATSMDMRLGLYGETEETRELYYAIFSRPHVANPAEAHASGKPILLFGANVHGFNYTLRESLLILSRELGRSGSDLNRLLDDVIVIIAPSKNPDGLEAESRFDALGGDLNRDYVALEHQSMASYVGRVLNHWHPHFVVDGHDGGAVQFGGAYPYHLLYQSSATAAADPSLTAFADHRIFPQIDREFSAAGLKSFYWARGDAERWYGGGSAVRMGRNYGGLSNKITVLFEMAEWPDTQTSVEAGIVAFRSLLHFASEAGAELVATVNEARNQTVRLGQSAKGSVPVVETSVAADTLVDFRTRRPDGELLNVTGAELIKRPQVEVSRARPFAYILPPQATEAVAVLRRHNIVVERFHTEIEVEASVYVLREFSFEEGENHHATMIRLDIDSEKSQVVQVPKHAYAVRTGQVLGRVVSHLLEPETSDNLYRWNKFTPFLPLSEMSVANQNDRASARILPVVRLMRPQPLPTVLVD